MNCNPPNGFENVKKNFGFGCMRLPMDGDKVDYAEFTRMVDRFMAEGFNYFDTARVYIDGQSETALRDCLVKRYPRESFLLVDKLSTSLFNSEEEIRPLFEIFSIHRQRTFSKNTKNVTHMKRHLLSATKER